MSQNKKGVKNSKEQLSLKFKMSKSGSTNHSYKTNNTSHARIYPLNSEAYWNKRILERK